ncbi:carbohydrate ABC transporter permease [Cohnella nanjingensis]|uniref:Sugar ABC transporter permease n=1 Tax=Cohnella nanjingensis TaxID=1387779 RepID=A0A7X0RTD9_9BACL|nr:sugar ABC transporter permease [Cohnella nanjingensis]MBB6671854.1 sugar ABC transporter permease [Cohnella nanjingensis]
MHTKRGKWLLGQEKTALYFLLPSFLVLGLFVFWPIINSFILSFYNWNLFDVVHPFVGLDNYRMLMQDERFWNSVYQTGYYTLLSVPIGIVLSLLLAVLIKLPLRGMTFFKAIYFLPVISSFAVIAIIWSFLLDPDIGLLSYYLHEWGIPVKDWLRNPDWAMPAVIMVAVWKNIGFNMVIFLAGLQEIPESVYEASKLDGAGPVRRFWSVTLPMLRHTLLFVVIISVISSFQVFDQVYVMTRGGPVFKTETIVYFIYHYGFEELDMGYASSASALLFVVVLLITLLQLRIFKFNETN